MRGRMPIMPERLRHIPRQFSWIDHRLVRDGHVEGRSAGALALYLFLVTVADAEGLSWYSEPALSRQLSWNAEQVRGARTELQQAGLIAYRKGLYQVLDLAPMLSVGRSSLRPSGEAVSIGETLAQMLASRLPSASHGSAGLGGDR